MHTHDLDAHRSSFHRSSFLLLTICATNLILLFLFYASYSTITITTRCTRAWFSPTNSLILRFLFYSSYYSTSSTFTLLLLPHLPPLPLFLVPHLPLRCTHTLLSIHFLFYYYHYLLIHTITSRCTPLPLDTHLPSFPCMH
jgi:hypothetical protein